MWVATQGISEDMEVQEVSADMDPMEREHMTSLMDSSEIAADNTFLRAKARDASYQSHALFHWVTRLASGCGSGRAGAHRRVPRGEGRGSPGPRRLSALDPPIRLKPLHLPFGRRTVSCWTLCSVPKWIQSNEHLPTRCRFVHRTDQTFSCSRTSSWTSRRRREARRCGRPRRKRGSSPR